MPYRSLGVIISGTQYNYRQKLASFQKAETFHHYIAEVASQRQLAREHGVSRRLIIFTVSPGSEERNKGLLRENEARSLYKYDRKKHTENIHNRRRYRQRLFQEGKITLKNG